MSSALERLKQQRRQATSVAAAANPPAPCPIGCEGGIRAARLACASNADNEDYMRRFDEGMRLIGAQRTQEEAEARPSPGRCATAAQQQQQQRREAAAAGALAAPSRRGEAGRRGLHASMPPFGPEQASQQPLASQQQHVCQEPPRSAGAFPLTPLAAWRAGPAAPGGRACQLSERLLLCAAAQWKVGGRGGEIAVGSSDHAVYIVDTASGQRRRTLYSKTAGHKE